MATKRTFSFCTNTWNPQWAMWAHLAPSGSQSEDRIRFILPTHGFSYIIKIVTCSNLLRRNDSNMKSGEYMRKMIIQSKTQEAWRKKSENSQQDLNLWPSGYQSRCSKGDVTRNDLQRRFLEQHSVATLLRHCFEYLQHCSNIATMCCAKYRRCESSRVTSP